MKVALVYPPACDPTAPYLAVPTLTAYLRGHGVEVVPIDANLEAFDALLEPAPLAALRDRIPHRPDAVEASLAYDVDELAAAEDHEAALWHELIHARRTVSRAAHEQLAAELPRATPRPGRYRCIAGEPPARVAGRRRPVAPRL